MKGHHQRVTIAAQTTPTTIDVVRFSAIDTGDRSFSRRLYVYRHVRFWCKCSSRVGAHVGQQDEAPSLCVVGHLRDDVEAREGEEEAEDWKGDRVLGEE